MSEVTDAGSAAEGKNAGVRAAYAAAARCASPTGPMNPTGVPLSAYTSCSVASTTDGTRRSASSFDSLSSRSPRMHTATKCPAAWGTVSMR